MTYDDDLERLLYCLRANLPHPVIGILLALVDDPDLLHDAWLIWSTEEYGLSDRTQFADTIVNITGCRIITCDGCAKWEWADDANPVIAGDMVCDTCLHNYTRCYECEVHTPDDDLHDVEGYKFCDRCRDNHCYYCENCDVWSRYEHDHDDGVCDCEAPHRRFRFPANGDGTVADDERLSVTLPAGVIDEVGRRRIRSLLIDQPDVTWEAVEKAMNAVGDMWQSKKGNYTRRLSRELYNFGKQTGQAIKVGDHALSEIGNLARQHSSDTSEWEVEFTRNLNLDAEDFCHGESCWWQSYANSRCALKQWGGIGLRAFDEYGSPEGRAWVQPLDSDMLPTHDALNAHAYVVYNTYGTLDEYKAARIVAHLTSKTYKKVGFSSTPQYINADGILVADEGTCQRTESIHLTGDAHRTYDADSIQTSQTNPTNDTTERAA